MKSDGRKFRTIWIVLKVDGSKAFPLEGSLSETVSNRKTDPEQRV